LGLENAGKTYTLLLSRRHRTDFLHSVNTFCQKLLWNRNFDSL